LQGPAAPPHLKNSPFVKRQSRRCRYAHTHRAAHQHSFVPAFAGTWPYDPACNSHHLTNPADGWLSLAHGAVLAAFCGLLLLAREHFWLLATSLYAISRALERGDVVNLHLVVSNWTRWQHSRYAVGGGYWCLVRFGLLLAVAGSGWVLTSAALITLMAPQPIHTPADFLRHVVLAPNHYVFKLWLTFGLGAFLLCMLFIIGHLAWQSKAGKFGTFLIFLGLEFGMLRLVAKYVLQWYLEK
jgi:hypothetical protein